MRRYLGSDHFGDEAARRRERRTRLAQLGPRADEHEQAHTAAPLHEVLNEIEK